jgi:hypothetical protein
VIFHARRLAGLQPIIGKVFRLEGPRPSGVDIQIAYVTVTIFRSLMQCPWLEVQVGTILDPAHCVVFLPALPAKHEWDEELRAVARDKHLRMKCQVPITFRLDAGVDGFSPAYKLVQPEGKHRKPCFRVPNLRPDL